MSERLTYDEWKRRTSAGVYVAPREVGPMTVAQFVEVCGMGGRFDVEMGWILWPYLMANSSSLATPSPSSSSSAS